MSHSFIASDKSNHFSTLIIKTRNVTGKTSSVLGTVVEKFICSVLVCRAVFTGPGAGPVAKMAQAEPKGNACDGEESVKVVIKSPSVDDG